MIDILCYGFTALYFINNILLIIAYIKHDSKFDSKIQKIGISSVILFIGTFLGAYHNIIHGPDSEFSNKRSINDLRNLELDLLKRDTNKIKLAGKTYTLDKQVKVELGLILNKYISKNY